MLWVNIGFTQRGKNGVDAFGCNSAESEPIWMKSEALSLQSTQLSLSRLLRARPGRFWARFRWKAVRARARNPVK